MYKNIFVCGGAVCGESFFGRKALINELEGILFYGRGARNVIGPTRIGKSSLVTQVLEKNKNFPHRICIQMNMGDCNSAYDFWRELLKSIKLSLTDTGLWNSAFLSRYQEWEKTVSFENTFWWSDYKICLKEILNEIRKQDYQLVLCIDEFDAVEKVFGGASHYYQLLRSIYSEPQYATSGVLISRRRFQLFEATCPYISTFHGVFPEIQVLPFTNEEMQEYYAALEKCGAVITDRGKQQLEYYTGNIPYLCCLLAAQIVLGTDDSCNYGDKEILAIFRKYQPQFDRHYDDLIAGMKDDNYLNFIYALAINSKCPRITDRDIENMCTMGILLREKTDAENQYYAVSKDFMMYLYLKPLKLPIWETMTSCEKQLKSIFQREFPELAEITYQQLLSADGKIVMNDIDTRYPELHLNWAQVKGYCQNLSTRKEFPTVLDVLTLSKVVGIMLKTWDKRFYRHFEGDDGWKLKLEVVSSIRNPMAHAQMEYVSNDELAICMKYCNEILHIEK